MSITFSERAQDFRKPGNPRYNKILDQLITISKKNNDTLPSTFCIEGGIESIYEVLCDLDYDIERIIAIKYSKSPVREVQVKRQ